MLDRLVIQEVQHYGRSCNNGLHIRILAIEDSERIQLKAANTIFIELIFHARKVLDQRLAVATPRFGRTQRVNLKS